MYKLKNDELTIMVSPHGAELTSIVDNTTGREYMWQADPAYWGRTSPVLFPFVGGSNAGHYRVDGVSYPMTQHGFARDCEFQFESLDEGDEESTIRFLLESHDGASKNYPYDFDLIIGYTLHGRAVTVTWEVVNCGTQDMLFSIGAHPAFHCPAEGHFFVLEHIIQEDDSSLEINANRLKKMSSLDKVLRLDEVRSRRIVDGLASDVIDTYSLEDGYLPIHNELFQYDALVIEEKQVQQVSLADEKKEIYLTVTFDMPLVGLWSPPGKNAPFVCIEPWCGRCDVLDFEGELQDRAYINRLKDGERFEQLYVIQV